MMRIAKYRNPEYPGVWILTDFAMEQAERRLDLLITENAELKKQIEEKDKQIKDLEEVIEHECE